VANTPVVPTVGIGAGSKDEKAQWMELYEEKLGKE
jgi:hypothetical protein